MPIDPEQLGKAAEGAAKSPFVVGLFGAIVTSIRGMPGSTWGEKASHAVSGALVAGFVSPGVAEWLGLTGEGILSANAFLHGMFGLNVSASVWEYLKTAKLVDWLPWRKKGD